MSISQRIKATEAEKGGIILKKKLALFLILAYVLMVTVNALANIIPINDITTGEVSDSYPNLFVPVPLTFSIWGVIYLLLLFFVIYQVREHLKEKGIRELSLLFIVSCLANSLWILVWHYQQIFLSLLVMIILFFLLLAIHRILPTRETGMSKKEWFFLHLPFSIYFGWITVATIANATAFLVSINWGGWGITPVFWTILVLLTATLIAVLMISQEGDIPYSLVVIWAFLGIVIQRITASPLYLSIILTGILGILCILFVSYRNWQEGKLNRTILL